MNKVSHVYSPWVAWSMCAHNGYISHLRTQKFFQAYHLTRRSAVSVKGFELAGKTRELALDLSHALLNKIFFRLKFSITII